MNFDPIAFKKQFPLFNQPGNHRLVYLDNAATSQRPLTVIDAVTHFYKTTNANANRSSHRLARSATAILESTREQAATFLGARSSDEVVFTSGATEGINMIAYGLRSFLTAGDSILLSITEHHANLVPWQETAKATGSQLLFADNLRSLFSLVQPHTKVIAVTGCSNSTGQIMDLSLLKKIKQAYPQLLVVMDASQLAAHRKLEVKHWSCDFLVCSAHKFYGPTGVGLLYGVAEKLQRLTPLKVGGEMIEQVDLHQSSYRQGPEKYEAGTAALSAIAGLNGCFEFWQQQDASAMFFHEQQLSEELHRQLNGFCQNYPALSLITTAENNCGIATLVSDTVALADIGWWLDEQDIAVRVGDHCAQPFWRSLGYSASLRVSLAAYNTHEDIARLLSALEGYFACHQSPSPESPQLDSLQQQFDNVLNEVDWRNFLQARPWQQRYKKLIELGRQIPENQALRKQEYRVAGCEAATWLSCTEERQLLFFSVDSESNLVKGLAALLLCRIQGESREFIRGFDFDAYLSSLHMAKYLSASRVNGLYALLKKIQALAGV